MSVLITGGAGFIGSHIADKLISNGYDVIIIDNLSTGNIKNINSSAKFYKEDIGSPAIGKIFADNKIEYVIHEAAQASVPVSMKDPIFDMKQNIAATVNLLDVCKKNGVKRIVVASTAAIYGKPKELPVKEGHSADLLSFYGLSKYTMENYVKMFGINYIIFRYGNVYGPRQDAMGEAGVVSIFIDKMSKGEIIEIHGDGAQTRDFVYAEDIADANLLAINSISSDEIINLSSMKKTSVNELFSVLNKIFGSKSKSVHVPARPGDIKDSLLDNQKAQKLLKWKPKIDLIEGLNKTAKSLSGS